MGLVSAAGRFAGRHVPDSVERALDGTLDKALAVQRPAVRAYLDLVRSRHPDATPAEVVEVLERHYLAAVVAIGGASGAAAAVPGAGTAASLATGVAEIGAFVTATSTFVLALAELHSIPLSDPEIRRALVVAVLLGESGAAAVGVTEAETRHWAQALGRSMAKERLTGINGRLGHLFLTRFGARQGALLFGRALPLGIGAGVGAVGNAALARSAVAAARRAFGPAPARFPSRVIDA